MSCLHLILNNSNEFVTLTSLNVDRIQMNLTQVDELFFFLYTDLFHIFFKKIEIIACFFYYYVNNSLGFDAKLY